MDETILRLLETVRSALYRYYLLHSVLMPLALAYIGPVAG